MMYGTSDACLDGRSAMIEPELIPLVAKRFKALGEPARLALLAALQHGERNVSELVEATRRGQPNVSQHLKELVHAGLIAARRDGNHVYYRIADRYVMRICDAVCKSLTAPVPGGPPASGASGRTRGPRAAARAQEVSRG
jgi:DNA-binding transcriptional ArsR family regulator